MRDGFLRGAFRLILHGLEENPRPSLSWPAGPYRGGAAQFLLRANQVWRGPAPIETELECDIEVSKQNWDFRREVSAPTKEDVPNSSSAVLGLCALGNPARFFADAEAAGWKLGARATFRDHSWFRPDSVERLKKLAHRHAGMPWLCSEKDAIALLPLSRDWKLPPPLVLKEKLFIHPDAMQALEQIFSRNTRGPALIH
jgi:tetraacyldisaccharide-1-P 4'-kinase